MKYEQIPHKKKYEHQFTHRHNSVWCMEIQVAAFPCVQNPGRCMVGDYEVVWTNSHTYVITCRWSDFTSSKSSWSVQVRRAGAKACFEEEVRRTIVMWCKIKLRGECWRTWDGFGRKTRKFSISLWRTSQTNIKNSSAKKWGKCQILTAAIIKRL
jgi:hypothetical protein